MESSSCPNQRVCTYPASTCEKCRTDHRNLAPQLYVPDGAERDNAHLHPTQCCVGMPASDRTRICEIRPPHSPTDGRHTHELTSAARPPTRYPEF